MIDNKKKYSEYVKVNFKPENNDKKKAFKYEKKEINRLGHQEIKKMGLSNLEFSKEKKTKMVGR